jgi:hypothetical protein
VDDKRTHQALAEELHMDISDPFTRVLVAALYWHARATYWKMQAAKSGAVQNTNQR